MCPTSPVLQLEPKEQDLKASSPQIVAKMCEETAESVIASLRGATTVMLCDIPLTLGGEGPQGIVDLLERHSLEDNVDYLYLPRGYGRKSKRRCNGSLSAFVNFTSPAAAAASVNAFHNYVIDDRRVYVCRAASQGVAQNLMHFRSVRSGRSVLETAWPWVRKEGRLQEAHPFEAGGILGIEPEIEAIRALVKAEADEKKAADLAEKAAAMAADFVAQNAADLAAKNAEKILAALEQADHTEKDKASDTASTTASETTEPSGGSPTLVQATDFSNVLPVPEDMIAAYAALLASMPAPAPDPVLDTWWTGQLDWTLLQAQSNGWPGH